MWASGSQAPRVLGVQGEGLGAGAPYQELQPPQQPVQPGLQGPQLGLQGPQGRAARPAQPLHVPQVGEQVGPQPRQHARELRDGVRGQERRPQARPPPVPRTRSPAPTCRAPSAPALMAKVGRESRLWSPSAGNLSLWGKKSYEGGPAQLWGSPHPPTTGLKRPLPVCAVGGQVAPRPAPARRPPSPTSCAASCRVSASRERVSRMALSSSARGSGEALGGPGGGPGAAARSGHRLSAARTRQQTPAGGRGRGFRPEGWSQGGGLGLGGGGRRVSCAPRRRARGWSPAGAGFPLPLRLWLPRPSEQTRPRAGRRAGRLPSAPGRRNLGPGAGREGAAQARTCPLPGPGNRAP